MTASYKPLLLNVSKFIKDGMCLLYFILNPFTKSDVYLIYCILNVYIMLIRIQCMYVSLYRICDF